MQDSARCRILSDAVGLGRDGARGPWVRGILWSDHLGDTSGYGGQQMKAAEVYTGLVDRELAKYVSHQFDRF
jgi:hypothetical protein